MPLMLEMTITLEERRGYAGFGEEEEEEEEGEDV